MSWINLVVGCVLAGVLLLEIIPQMMNQIFKAYYKQKLIYQIAAKKADIKSLLALTDDDFREVEDIDRGQAPQEFKYTEPRTYTER